MNLDNHPLSSTYRTPNAHVFFPKKSFSIRHNTQFNFVYNQQNSNYSHRSSFKHIKVVWLLINVFESSAHICCTHTQLTIAISKLLENMESGKYPPKKHSTKTYKTYIYEAKPIAECEWTYKPKRANKHPIKKCCLSVKQS